MELCIAGRVSCYQGQLKSTVYYLLCYKEMSIQETDTEKTEMNALQWIDFH
jgi:hypothetical protein